jgi:hypothetical protein
VLRQVLQLILSTLFSAHFSACFSAFFFFFSATDFSQGFLFWFFFLDPLYLKKKELRLFFRPQGSLKNRSDSGRAFLFANFFFQRKSCGAL